MHPKPPKRPMLTHFLCLPLCTPSSKPQWQSSIQTFTRDISERGLNPEAIPSVDMLHLTLGVMSLTTEEKKTAACELLKGDEVRRLIWRSAGTNCEGEEGERNSTPQERLGSDKSDRKEFAAIPSTQQDLTAENSAATAPSARRRPRQAENAHSNKLSPPPPLSAYSS